MFLGTPQEILPIFFDEDMGEDIISSSAPKDSSSTRLRLRSIVPKLTESNRSDEILAGTDPLNQSGDFINKPENPNTSTDCNEEHKFEGAICFTVYKSYWKAIGKGISVSILVFLFLMQATKNLGDIWLAHWVSASSNTSEPVTPSPTPPSVHEAEFHSKSTTYFDLSPLKNRKAAFWDIIHTFGSYVPVLKDSESDVKFYFTVFVLIGVVNSLFALGRAFLFAYGAIEGGRRLHTRLLHVVLKVMLKRFTLPISSSFTAII